MKACSKCGETKEYSEFGKNSWTKDNFEYQCKVCKKTYYDSNKGKRASYAKKYKDNNKEAVAKHAREYYQTNKESCLIHRRNWQRRSRNELFDGYVKRVLFQQYGIKNFPIELIELKRAEITAKRELKRLKNI